MEVGRLLALPVVEELADHQPATTGWQGMPHSGGRVFGAGTGTEEEFEGAVLIGLEVVAVHRKELLNLPFRKISGHHRET